MSEAPFRQQFDAAMSPLAARNALGITSTGGGGGAPTTAEYITASADATLTNERVLTDTATVIWDFTTAGQAKANATSTGGVPTTRTITAGAGLFGGGDLSADRIIDVGSGEGIQTGVNVVALDFNGLVEMTLPPDPGDFLCAYHLVATAHRKIKVSTLGFAPLASPTFTGDPKSVTPATGDNDTSIATTAFVTTAISTQAIGPPQGRLSLVTAMPVMSTSATGITIIYYAAYVGNLLPIFDGTQFVMTVITGNQISCILSDTTKNPAAIGAAKVNDWFVWNDAGTIRLSHGPDWTNDTTRSAGTAIQLINGIHTNSVAITNGPSQFRGTYVGTTRSNSTVAVLDWLFGSSAVGGQAAFFGVWNYYNRVNVATQVRDTTDSWTLASGTTRQANSSSAMCVFYVSGIAEDCFFAQYAATANTGTGFAAFGVGYDSITALSGQIGFFNTGGTAGATMASFGSFTTPPAIGLHYLQAMETCGGGGGAAVATVYGDASLPLQAQNGLTVMLRM